MYILFYRCLLLYKDTNIIFMLHLYTKYLNMSIHMSKIRTKS